MNKTNHFTIVKKLTLFANFVIVSLALLPRETYAQCGTQGLSASPNLTQGCAGQQIAYTFSPGGLQIVSNPSWSIIPTTAGSLSGSNYSATVVWSGSGKIKIEYPVRESNGQVVLRCSEMSFTIPSPNSYSAGSVSGTGTICDVGDAILTVTGAQSAGGMVWQQCSSGCSDDANWGTAQGTVSGSTLTVVGLSITTWYRTKLDYSTACFAGTKYSNAHQVTVAPSRTISVAIYDPGPICSNDAASKVIHILPSSYLGTNPEIVWYRGTSSYIDNPLGDSNPDPWIFDPYDQNYGFHIGDQIQVKVTSSNACDSSDPAYSNLVTITSPPETFPAVNSIQVNPNPICSGGSATFTIKTSASGNNISGNWHVGSGGLPYNGTNYTVPADQLSSPGSNIVYFSGYVTGSCGTQQAVSTNTGTLTVMPSYSPSVGLGGTSVCAGTSGATDPQFTATPYNKGPFNVTYDWFINGSHQEHNTDGIFDPAAISPGDNVRVVMSIINPVCIPPSVENTSQFTIRPSNNIHLQIYDPGPICSDDAASKVIHILPSSYLGTNPEIVWYRGTSSYIDNPLGDSNPDPWIFDPYDQNYGFHVGDQIQVKVTSSNSCDLPRPAESNVVTIQAQQETFPVLNSIQVNPNPICSGAPVTFKINTTTSSAFISGDWHVGSGGFASSGSAYILPNGDILATPDNNTVYFSGTVTGSCGTIQAVSTSIGGLTVQPKPIAFANNDELCSGETTSIRLSSTIPGTTFQWTASYDGVSGSSSSGSGDRIEQVLTTNGGSTGTATYTVTSTSPSQCAGDPVYRVAAVEPHPINPTLPSEQFCEFEPVTLSAQPTGDIVTFLWYDNNEAYLGKGASQRVSIMPSGSYSYKFKSVSRIGCVSTTFGTFNANVVSSGCDDNMNWIETITYNPVNPAEPEVIGNTKSYYDLTGQLVQSQAKDMVSGRVSVSQALADELGRPAISTLSAPTEMSSFLYKHWFVTNENGELYNYSKFDDPVNTSSHEKSGWYYSGNNNVEQHIPATGYPYTRVDYYNDGSGEIRRSAGPGDQHRLEMGHEVWSGTFPVFAELDDYIQKYKSEFPGLISIVSLKDEAVQTVSRDENGKFAIVIADKSGKTLLSCRSGSSDDHVLAVTNAMTISDPAESYHRPMTYFYLADKGPVGITGSTGFVVEDLISNMRKEPGATFADANGNWPAGFYRILLDDHDSEIELTYTNYFADVSYQFYDGTGRVLASVSHNGYKKWKDGALDYDYIDKTTYQYNHRGWLLEMTEPDAGTTAYQYRKDSKIRFSQNAQQRVNESATENNDKGKFSYTNYDGLGRPVESGEYIGNNILFSSLGSQLEHDQQTDFSDDKHDWIKTAYDVPDLDCIPNLPATFRQEFVRGAVSFTENTNIKTWYSYDEAGRVKRMAQKPAQLNRTFVTEYTYGFLGQVLMIHNASYTDQTPSDHFYHHYEYDADMRLSRSYTSMDGSDKKLRATYTYYLHGPLKRIELGDQIQGIDFVYNINGWLTQINHPDKMQDPGGDTNDAFGMVLDYYESALNGVFQSTQVNPNERELYRIHNIPNVNRPCPSSAFYSNKDYAHKQGLMNGLEQVRHWLDSNGVNEMPEQN